MTRDQFEASQELCATERAKLRSVEDLQESWLLFRTAYEAGGRPDPYPVLVEMMDVILALNARVADLNEQIASMHRPQWLGNPVDGGS